MAQPVVVALVCSTLVFIHFVLSHLKMKRGLNYCKSQDQASISILFGFYLTFRKPNQSKKKLHLR